MSRKHKKNSTAYIGGALRAYRPVVAGEWFDEMSEKLWETAGTTFKLTERTNDLRLTLIGSSEITRAKRMSTKLGSCCMKQVAASAREYVNDSFREPIQLAPSRLMVRRYREGHFLGLGICEPQLFEEYESLQHGITIAAGEKLEWFDTGIFMVKIGVPVDRFEKDILEAIQIALPERITALAGSVSPITKPSNPAIIPSQQL